MVYLIVGNGPAGTHAIERIRQIDRTGRIILVSQENNLPYSRIMTPEYMTHEVEEQDLYIRGQDFYAKNDVETRLGHRVAQLLAQEKRVILDNGEQISYDKLLIATGSRPFIPHRLDLNVQGVFSLWNKADAEEINTYLSTVQKAVIIGGGLVGLKAAWALHVHGINVTLVEMAERLMPLQLDQIAGDMLLNALLKHGVQVYLSTEVESLLVQNNKVQGVQTHAQVLPADMILIATGVRPNLEFLSGVDIWIDRGIVVNEYMESSIPDVYAAGDVAQAPSAFSGELVLRALWPTAVQQGKVAGANMAGLKERYPGSHGMNSIQLFGLPIIALGRIAGGPGVEELILKYPSSGGYQKLLLEKGRLVGVLFAGNVQDAGVLYHKLGQPLNRGYWGASKVVGEEELFV